jgi:hypothetical protein
MRDLGELKTFVGIQIERLPNGGVFIHQTDYSRQILDRFGITAGNAAKLPYDKKLVLKKREDQCPQADLKRFQEMVGCLMWLATISRPDLAWVTSKLAQYSANPPQEAITACKTALRYLIGTADLGILYTKEGAANELTGWTDSNWGDPHSQDDSKSISGNVFTLANAPISWSSRKQRTTATSSTEAEYVAQCSATKECFYLRQFLGELGLAIQGPTTINADNTSAIALAQNPIYQGKSRHIDFQYHYTREKIEDGTISLNYIPTTQMVADGLTKPLTLAKIKDFYAQLGLQHWETAKYGNGTVGASRGRTTQRRQHE